MPEIKQAGAGAGGAGDGWQTLSLADATLDDGASVYDAGSSDLAAGTVALLAATSLIGTSRSCLSFYWSLPHDPADLRGLEVLLPVTGFALGSNYRALALAVLDVANQATSKGRRVACWGNTSGTPRIEANDAWAARGDIPTIASPTALYGLFSWGVESGTETLRTTYASHYTAADESDDGGQAGGVQAWSPGANVILALQIHQAATAVATTHTGLSPQYRVLSI